MEQQPEMVPEDEPRLVLKYHIYKTVKHLY